MPRTEYGERDRVLDRGHGVGGAARVIALVRQPYALNEHRAAVLVLVRHGHGARVQGLIVFQPLDGQRPVALGDETLPSDAAALVVTVAHRERVDVRWFCEHDARPGPVRGRLVKSRGRTCRPLALPLHSPPLHSRAGSARIAKEVRKIPRSRIPTLLAVVYS